MTKYNQLFKQQVIEFYLQHNKDRALTRKKFHLTESTLRRWIEQFQHFGYEGLAVSTTKTHYPVEFKLAVLDYMNTHALSYRQTSLHFAIPNESMVYQWLQAFQKDGINGLIAKPKGRPSMKPKYPKMPPKPQTREEELELENLRLRAEIAVLKKLQELHQQKIVKKPTS